MDYTKQMSVEAFCMAVGVNGCLLHQFSEEVWHLTLVAHYPKWNTEGNVWEFHRGQLVAHGNPEHPALYTRKSINKMLGLENIKAFWDEYARNWEAYRHWQNEQIEADEIALEGTDGEEPDDIADAVFVADDVVEVVRVEPEPNAGIPPSNSWYGSPDGPYNQ